MTHSKTSGKRRATGVSPLTRVDQPRAPPVALSSRPPDPLGSTRSIRSQAGNRGNVDGNQQRLVNFLTISITREHASGHWHHDAIKVLIVRRIVCAGSSAHDVHGVIMAPQQTIHTKV